MNKPKFVRHIRERGCPIAERNGMSLHFYVCVYATPPSVKNKKRIKYYHWRAGTEHNLYVNITRLNAPQQVKGNRNIKYRGGGARVQ